MAREKRGDRRSEFERRLLRWYRSSRRDFPWRGASTAYRVWISEVMLQQTRAATVLPYYRRFLRAFPSLAALARAPAERVLRAWAGLGYYRRARHLHRAAKIVVKEYGGRFPRTLEAARELPGVGEYTARAILSIAYGQPAAVLDGNVARVIARREAIAGDLRIPARWNELQAIADRWLCREAPGDWNQAMMELGATICTPRQPHCGDCPVRAGCEAFRLGIAGQLPERRRKQALVRLRVAAAVFLDSRGRTLLVRSSPPGLAASDRWLQPPSHSGVGASAPTKRGPNPRALAPEARPARILQRPAKVSEGELAPIFSRLWHFPAQESASDGREEPWRAVVHEGGRRRLERSLTAALVAQPFLAVRFSSKQGQPRTGRNACAASPAHNLQTWRWQALPELRHSVTYRQITIEPWLVFVDSLPSLSYSRAVPLDRVSRMAVSSASRKIAAAALDALRECHRDA